MQITSLNHTSSDLADVVALPYWQGQTEITKAYMESEPESPSPWKRDFFGKNGESFLFYAAEPSDRRLLAIGLGKEESISLEQLRRAYAQLFLYCRRMKWLKIALQLPHCQLSESIVIRAIVEAAMLVNYHFTRYKSKEERGQPLIQQLILNSSEEAIKEAKRWLVIGEAMHLARDLVNGSADEINPQFLAGYAQLLAEKYSLNCIIHDQAALEAQKMGLILAVSRSAMYEPVLIELSYQGDPSSIEQEVWIGKGVTYDTGGFTLKTPDSMETMRGDMAGAAAVLAALEAVVRLQIPVNLTVLVPATENAIDSSSYKLGDVYRAYDGTTVEIGNTDAEGRLILADTIAYARQKFNPSRIIDIATLTGAIIVALGRERMGLFSNDPALAERFLKAGESCHERLFQMPLDDEYAEDLKSDFADLRNVGTRQGGAILAAQFLKRFVGKTPWVHLDIASMALLPKPHRYHPRGATGVGVRLLVESLL